MNKNKWDFSESQNKMAQDRRVYEIFIIGSKSDYFYPDRDLALGPLRKWVSPLDSTFQMTRATCSHDIFTIFSSGGFIWPDLDHISKGLATPVLSISPYLYGPFVIPSEAFSQNLRSQLSRLPAADRAKRVSFDLWHDLDPTFDPWKIKTALESLRWELWIALLAPPISSEEGKTGEIYVPAPSPPLANGMWLKTQRPPVNLVNAIKAFEEFSY